MRKPDYCKGCPWYGDGEGFVPDELNVDAKIAIITPSPIGKDEEFATPFCSPMGKMVEGNLIKYGLSRQDASWINVLKCRCKHEDAIPEDETTPKAIEHCRQLLLESLAQIHPNVSVPLGDIPLGATIQKAGIEKWRGSVILHDEQKYVPTLPPSYLWKNPELRSATKSDFARIVRESQTVGKIINYDDNFQENTSAGNFCEILRGLGKSRRRISLDIETSYAKPFEADLRIVGMAWNKNQAANVDWQWCSAEEQNATLRALSSYPGEIITATPFDFTVLSRLGATFNYSLCHDLTLLHSRFDIECPHTLEFIASMWTDREYWKYLAPTQPYYYNCLDCVAEWEAFDRLYGYCRARDSKILTCYNNDRLNGIPLAVALHLNGMPFSEEAFSAEQAYYETKRADIESDLRQALEGLREPLPAKPESCPNHPRYTGKTHVKLRKGEDQPCDRCTELRCWVEAAKPLNIRSRNQMMALLEGDGIAIPTKRGTEEKQFDKAALAKIAGRIPQEKRKLIVDLMNWKRQDKILSSFFAKNPASPDGRLHSTYAMHSAMHRWNSSKPNCQQFMRPE